MTLPLNRNKVTMTARSLKLYPFEGLMLSVKQIHERVTAVSESVIRDRLKECVTTIAGMLSERKNDRNHRAACKRAAANRNSQEWKGTGL